MLSETYVLWQALNRAGLAIPREHPRVKQPGFTVGPCLRVRLDAEGHVAAVESVTRNEWPGLWTTMEGNQNSFPVVRIKEPLLKVPRESVTWEKLGFDAQGRRKTPPEGTARLSTLADALEQTSSRFAAGGERFWLRLQGKARELLQGGNDGPEGRLLQEFAGRFQGAANLPDVLLGEIAEHALEGVRTARLEALDTVEALLVGKGPPDDRGRQPSMAVQLAFDHQGEAPYGVRLYSEKMRRYVKRILPIDQEAGATRGERDGKHPARACAFTGEGEPLQVRPFPKVKLPVLNKEFPLVSMFSEASCNKRYGLTDALVVPVARDAALQMQDALTWIVAEERKGKTWRGVASGKFETRQGRKRESSDLLVVYVDGKPEIDANVADLFGRDEGVQEKQFDVDAQTVCKALDGFEKEHPGSKLNLFLLRKASEGQAHVALAQSPSVEEVLRAARSWQEGAGNVPGVSLPFPVGKGEAAVWREPRAPHPEQVVRLLSEEWVTNGARSNKVQGIGLGEVLDLMLQTPGRWRAVAERMLGLTVRRLGPLLLGLSAAMHADDTRRWSEFPARSRETALTAVSTLGILLHAVGRRKETYMKERAFLVGRLLSLADTLHREYCKHVRDGGIPPQLIGNGLMPAAADNPTDAVDRLRERVMLYKAWADKSDGDAYRLAKWAVGQMGQVSHQLAEVGLPTETDQAFRAELFLGYMARATAE